jgi:uncharacterized protein (DUF1800 family)
MRVLKTMCVSAAFLAAALSIVPACEADALSARDSAAHVLNRLAFGPLPDDVGHVTQHGVWTWFEDQLRADPRHDDQLKQHEHSYDGLKLSSSDWARLFVHEQDAARMRKNEKALVQSSGSMMDSTATAPKTPQLPPTPEQKEARRLAGEVQQIALTRAVIAHGQLHEVMSDFWTNHFNVFVNKGQDRYMLPGFIEDVIRPRALGKFEDLLIETARSPAMLFYLDNAESVAEEDERPIRMTPRGHYDAYYLPPPRYAPPGMYAPRPPSNAKRRGINENYARELLELHTLGVDGGYTQQDVINVARILTGWSVRPPAEGGGFIFREAVHDVGEKVVLGQRFPAGHGEDEGIRLLQMLARHPATIHHICRKLCARFVSDDPPDGCVDAAVAAWQKSDGDMREVLRAIVHSDDFWSARAVRSMVKSPLEFVVSALRAVDADPDSTPRLAQAVAKLGEPLYQQASPAGYPEREEDWVNSGALLGRMNFAVTLASGHQGGAFVDLDAVVTANADHEALATEVNDRILGGTMSDHTRRVILEQIADLANPREARALAVGLALGSPEFQRQ